MGALAQLGERLICIQEVIGSIPIGSTKLLRDLVSARKRLPSIACVTLMTEDRQFDRRTLPEVFHRPTGRSLRREP